MSKRIQVTIDEDMYSLMMQLGDLRGETLSKIAGDVLDTYRERWALEIARWKVARSKEEAVAVEIEQLRESNLQADLHRVRREVQLTLGGLGKKRGR